MKTLKFNDWEEAKSIFNKDRIYLTLCDVKCIAGNDVTMCEIVYSSGDWKCVPPHRDDGVQYTSDFTPLIKYAFEMERRN